jgi:phage tail sheath protein FI
MAGVYARVDGTRGVHKAPGNEIVRNCIGLEVNITKGEHDTLNPIGVNAIRSFPGRGIRIWGARTLSSDASWRYINVRRLFNMIEESIERGTQWVVFEPNDSMLWGRLRRDVTAFLTLVWRSGALFGGAPSEAFYVKCDAETNPPAVRDVGQLVVEVGICPVKPAEFVIFRVSQWAGPSAE